MNNSIVAIKGQAVQTGMGMYTRAKEVVIGFSQQAKVLFEKAAMATAKATGQAVRSTSSLIKKHWKSILVFSASSVVAGAVTSGLMGAIMVTGGLYAVGETARLYLENRKTGVDQPPLSYVLHGLTHFSMGVFTAGMASLLFLFVVPSLLVSLHAMFIHLVDAYLLTAFFYMA